MILNSLYRRILAVMAIAILIASVAGNTSAEVTPGYNNEIPESIMTPDKVKTRIGTLKFFDGIPTKKTAELVYDNLD